MRSAVSSRDSVAAASVSTSARTATGRFSRKIDCHETCSTRKPPTTGPTASASALTPAHVPMALPRSAGGKAWETIDSVAGIMNAPPTPCTARQATSHASLWASAMSPLATAKTTTPTRNIRTRPNRSPRRPAVTSRTANASVYALTVHSRPDSVVCRSRWIDGSATLTTVLSSIAMNRAQHIAPSTHQRRLSSVIGNLIGVQPPGRRGSGRPRRSAPRGARTAGGRSARSARTCAPPRRAAGRRRPRG